MEYNYWDNAAPLSGGRNAKGFDLMKKTVGIIFADSMEYAPFLDFAVKNGAEEKMRRGCRSAEFTIKSGENELLVRGVESGIGKVRAASAAAFLIAELDPDCILNAGLSGAVSKVRREDIVAGESYVECDFDLRAIGYELAVRPDGEEYIHPADGHLLALAKEIPGMLSGRLGTGDIFLSDSEKKKLFKKLFGLTAFDMETGAIAAVCRQNGVPFLSVRKISDDADDASAEAYREMNSRREACLTNALEQILLKLLAEM